MDSTGRRLKNRREKSGLTQDDLAQKMGKASKQVISNWENDKNEPNLKEIKILAEIFGTTVAYLIGESDDAGNVSSDTITISKDEFIALQRKALQQEEAKVKKLEEKVAQLKND